MAQLTPLSTLKEFDEPVRKVLADYWITTAEEFSGAFRMSRQMKTTLAQTLRVSEERVQALFNAANAVPGAASFDAGPELEVGFGLVLDGSEQPDAASFDTRDLVDLPPAVEPLGNLPPPFDQGSRNSCVAFSMAALYQIASGDPTDLSEQFLYWACKERDKVPGDNGTIPTVAAEVLKELGICPEARWPYSPLRNDAQPGHAPPPEEVRQEARLRRIRRYRTLPPTSVAQIQAALAQGKGVLIGLYIYEHWLGTGQGTRLGRVRRQFPNEANKGGHAMAVVGYREDESAPGGGYFIVRNSWGVGWATENPDGAGYCHVPFKLVAEQNLAALVIDEIEPRTDLPPPTTKAATPLGAEGEPTIADLLAELRATRAELKAEIQSLRDEFSGILKTLTSTQAALDQARRRLGGGRKGER